MKLLREIDVPPVWLALFLGLVWLLPGGGLPAALSVVGWALIGLSVATFVWATLAFRRHRTSIIPRRRPNALMADGPYRLSRNPIYLADAGLLAGISLVVGSLVGLVLTPAFMWLITERFIKGEAAGLIAAFPEEAAAFFKATRRWL